MKLWKSMNLPVTSAKSKNPESVCSGFVWQCQNIETGWTKKVDDLVRDEYGSLFQLDRLNSPNTWSSGRLKTVNRARPKRKDRGPKWSIPVLTISTQCPWWAHELLEIFRFPLLLHYRSRLTNRGRLFVEQIKFSKAVPHLGFGKGKPNAHRAYILWWIMVTFADLKPQSNVSAKCDTAA